VYWSAQILFFGAEFTQVYAREHGSHCHSERSEESGRVVPPRTLLLPASAHRSGSLATLGMTFIGLFFGAIVGGIGALLMIFKSAKKLVTLH